MGLRDFGVKQFRGWGLEIYLGLGNYPILNCLIPNTAFNKFGSSTIYTEKPFECERRGGSKPPRR
jgi:hypothetical protein